MGLAACGKAHTSEDLLTRKRLQNIKARGAAGGQLRGDQAGERRDNKEENQRADGDREDEARAGQRERAHEHGADGKPNPTYRCLFPEPPPPGTVPACAEAGILGALAGVVGSMMALEVIREIVGFGEGLVGRLLMLDARAMRFETLRYAWDAANPLSGDQPTIHDLSVHG